MSTFNRRYIYRYTLPEMFDQSVLKYMDATCQTWKDETGKIQKLSYAQVGRIVKELSIGLLSLDLNKQDRVAIMSYNIPQWLWADFAILSAGAITVTIYPTSSHRELAHIINDSQTRFLFMESAKSLNKAANIWSEMPSLEKIIIMRDDYSGHHSAILNLSELRRTGSALMRETRPKFDARWRSIDLHDPLTIIYTSGTTGQQKGVVHTHLSLNAAIARDLTIMPTIKEEDQLLSILPLSHSFERQCGHMLTLSTGGSIAYPSSTGSSLLQDFQTFQPSWFLGVPEIYVSLLEDISRHLGTLMDQQLIENALETALETADYLLDKDGYIGFFESAMLPVELREKYLQADQEVFSAVRSLVGGRYRFSYSAAGALPAIVCKLFAIMDLRIMEGYGLVESSNTVTANNINRIVPGSVGILCPGVEAVSADDGEFLIRTDTLFLEYWNDPFATRKAFTEDGFFKTGDIMTQTDQQDWFLLDRKKSILALTSGRKVSTAKYDRLIAQGRLISQICPIGDDKPYVTALVVPNFDLFLQIFEEKNIDINREDLQYKGENNHRSCIKVGMDFIRQPLLRTLIAQEIERINAELEDYELISDYTILNRQFSPLTDELTPTGKLRRKTIIEHFAIEIENMYRP